MLLRSLTSGLRLLDLSQFALARGRCPVCGPTLLVKLKDRPAGVRCLRCRTGLTSAALIAAVKREVPDLRTRHVYELSSRGAVFRYLRDHAGRLSYSEYFDGAARGETRRGVRCEDVQSLTWPDASFDVCTSTEVFEHVPNDRRGFREIWRVLKPGGLLAFTVPLNLNARTRERARFAQGKLEHLLPPEYHGDHLRGAGRVLAFRNYGTDIVERLREAGFADAVFRRFPSHDGWFGFHRHAVTAHKPF
ncbi:MAG: class I SAM-dependent methyltransferase [Bacillota bacterium]